MKASWPVRRGGVLSLVLGVMTLPYLISWALACDSDFCPPPPPPFFCGPFTTPSCGNTQTIGGSQVVGQLTANQQQTTFGSIETILKGYRDQFQSQPSFFGVTPPLTGPSGTTIQFPNHP